MATEASDTSERQQRKYGWVDVSMLGEILAALSVIFLVGLVVIFVFTETEPFSAEAIVAIVSPALAAVGTVAAGVFGYSIGTRGSEAAQKTASEVTREATAARQEAVTTFETAGSLASTVQRIHKQAMGGQPTASGKREISEDDLLTMDAAAQQVRAKLPTV